MFMRVGVIVLAVLCVLSPVFAAQLEGTIYTTELEIAQNILVEINTTPTQRMLSINGTYTFSVSPGSYALIAIYKDGSINATSTDYVTIVENGSFVFDLFLLPDFSGDELSFDELPHEETGLTEVHPMTTPSDVATRLVIVLALFGFLFLVWRFLRHKEIPPEEDDDLTLLLRILEKNGGRATQKQIRKEMPYSEAKISLLIGELEAKGKVQKLKKGRANMIFLKK